ncbi:MAG: hypothetical protein ACLU6F_01740 [[Ruminococcus] torques]
MEGITLLMEVTTVTSGTWTFHIEESIIMIYCILPAFKTPSCEEREQMDEARTYELAALKTVCIRAWSKRQ